MDNYRTLLAIAISFVILIGYQFIIKYTHPDEVQTLPQAAQQTTGDVKQPAPSATQITSPAEDLQPGLPSTLVVPAAPEENALPARETVVETPLYTATFTEDGAALKSFILKEYRETNDDDSPGKELLPDEQTGEGSVLFSWGASVPGNLRYSRENDAVSFVDGKGTLRFTAATSDGVRVEKTFTFSRDSYLINLDVRVVNASGQILQGVPQIVQIDHPFQHAKAVNRFNFQGAAAFGANSLHKIKTKDLKEGAQTLPGGFDWVGFEGTYFICALLPLQNTAASLKVSGTEEKVTSVLSGELESLPVGKESLHSYRLFYGPKKFTLLKEIGYNLEKSVDFGWFAVIAKPTLTLLNFFHSIVGNYGLAIILVTVLYKAIFWPITHKGLSSMKNMQKLQPKIAKLRETHKNDPAALNRETMALYKAYKVNPLGGCLPMIIQIPVFFALYKVLLICIELRHAPFMLWITDLSAPDRLWIGFDIPWLGGIPVLTLLMGASMFLQQKMSPTAVDPSQAKIMMMLPIIFTFMFLNFASGLVLYWFVNNLLSILQQYMINRSVAAKAA